MQHEVETQPGTWLTVTLAEGRKAVAQPGSIEGVKHFTERLFFSWSPPPRLVYTVVTLGLLFYTRKRAL